MRPKKESLVLPCKLTEEQIREYGIKLAEELPKEDMLDNELKNFKDEVNARKSKVHAEIVELMNRINMKKEYREVECVIKYDFDKGEKIWIRTDTMELVHREPIPEKELQEELPLETPTERSEG